MKVDHCHYIISPSSLSMLALSQFDQVPGGNQSATTESTGFRSVWVSCSGMAWNRQRSCVDIWSCWILIVGVFRHNKYNHMVSVIPVSCAASSTLLLLRACLVGFFAPLPAALLGMGDISTGSCTDTFHHFPSMDSALHTSCCWSQRSKAGQPSTYVQAVATVNWWGTAIRTPTQHGSWK